MKYKIIYIPDQIINEFPVDTREEAERLADSLNETVGDIAFGVVEVCDETVKPHTHVLKLNRVSLVWKCNVCDYSIADQTLPKATIASAPEQEYALRAKLDMAA